MDSAKIISREELGDMYYELRSQFHSYFSPWSNMMGPQGDPEVTKKEIREKMDAIEKELGQDFLLIIRQKKEIRQLEKHLKDYMKNNDELEERIERLEACVTELYCHKKNRRDAQSFSHCESEIPSKLVLDSGNYCPSLIRI